MQFEKIIGQTPIKHLLIQMADANRVPHAQLFLGPAGCGKLALALAFAQYLLCENRPGSDACGTCPNCIKAGKYIHPDIHFAFPVVGTKMISNDYLTQWRSFLAETPYADVNDWLQTIGAENKQGNISKHECVNIIKKLSLKSFESGYKVLILWLPEYLRKEGNRLLKLIEEPPENTFFILVAEDSERILNTILSRCQIVKINALSDEDISNTLMEQKGISKEAALSLAQLADGNFAQALQLESDEENNNAILFLDWMRKCYKGNGVELVKWVDKFAKHGRENQKYFFQYALHFMREYMIYKLTGNDRVRLLPKELETARRLSSVIEFEQIEDITALFNNCMFAIERNANPKVLFLDASIQLHNMLRPVKVA